MHRRHRLGVPARRPRPRVRHRPDRRPTAISASCSRPSAFSARPRLALFRAGAVSDLSVAASAQAAGAAVAAKRGRLDGALLLQREQMRVRVLVEFRDRGTGIEVRAGEACFCGRRRSRAEGLGRRAIAAWPALETAESMSDETVDSAPSASPIEPNMAVSPAHPDARPAPKQETRIRLDVFDASTSAPAGSFSLCRQILPPCRRLTSLGRSRPGRVARRRAACYPNGIRSPAHAPADHRAVDPFGRFRQIGR